MNKKLLLSLGSIAAIAAPVAAVVACGSDDKNTKDEDTKSIQAITKEQVRDKINANLGPTKATTLPSKLHIPTDAIEIANGVKGTIKSTKDVNDAEGKLTFVVELTKGDGTPRTIDVAVQGFRTIEQAATTDVKIQGLTTNDLNTLVDNTKLNTEITVDDVVAALNGINGISGIVANDIEIGTGHDGKVHIGINNHGDRKDIVLTGFAKTEIEKINAKLQGIALTGTEVQVPLSARPGKNNVLQTVGDWSPELKVVTGGFINTLVFNHTNGNPNGQYSTITFYSDTKLIRNQLPNVWKNPGGNVTVNSFDSVENDKTLVVYSDASTSLIAEFKVWYTNEIGADISAIDAWATLIARPYGRQPLADALKNKFDYLKSDEVQNILNPTNP